MQNQAQTASLWGDAWRRLRKNRLAVAGLWILCAVTLFSVVAPWCSSYAYDQQDITLGASGPSWRHWCGTDELGRDLLVRLGHGGRVSLLVGLSATAVSLMIGVLYGAVAGFLGGRADALMMRITDILYALPFTILVVILMAFFGRHFFLLFLAIGAVQWLTMARIVRGQVLSLREKEFIEAATVLGFSKSRIVFHHLVPNALGPIIVYATLTVPNVMLLEAFLSFLGLGVQAPMSSWGLLIQDGAGRMEDYPWLLLFPSLALGATLFALNFVGDGLRDALDPRSAQD